MVLRCVWRCATRLHSGCGAAWCGVVAYVAASSAASVAVQAAMWGLVRGQRWRTTGVQSVGSGVGRSKQGRKDTWRVCVKMSEARE